MSKQDFKDIKKAFKEAARTLDGTLDEFTNTHDISKLLFVYGTLDLKKCKTYLIITFHFTQRKSKRSTIVPRVKSLLLRKR